MSREAFLDAVKAGDAARVTALAAEPGMLAARTEQGISAIRHAVYNGQRAIAELLASRGAPLDLFDAAALGDVAAIERLVAAHPDQLGAFSSDGWTPLHLAAFFGHADAARSLIAAGAPLEATARNDHGNTALHAAVAGGHDEVIEALLAAHANAGAREISGLTPLHLAAHAGNTRAVKRLLAAGARRDARSHDGRRVTDMIEADAPDMAALLDDEP